MDEILIDNTTMSKQTRLQKIKQNIIVAIIFPSWLAGIFLLSLVDREKTPRARWAWARELLLGLRYPQKDRVR